MHNLGQALRSHRESLGMDLDEVERRTKIRRRYLEALEEGDWGVLPGDVYARGFVRSYAECVGLDGLKLLEQYVDEPKALRTLGRSDKGRDVEHSTLSPVEKSAKERADVEETDVKSTHAGRTTVEGAAESPSPGSTQRSTENDANMNPWSANASERQKGEEGAPYTPPVKRNVSPAAYRSSSKRSKTGGAVGQGIAVVVAFAVVAGAWWMIRNNHSSQAPTASVNQSATTHHTGGNGANLNNTADSSSTNVVASGGNSTQNNVGGTDAGNTAGNSSASSSTAVVTQQPFDAANQQLNVTVTGSEPIVLGATASGGQCWVAVTGDGKTIDGNDFVVPGKTKTWSALQEVRIKMGNVPVVSMTVNGTPIVLPSTQNVIYVDVKKTP